MRFLRFQTCSWGKQHLSLGPFPVGRINKVYRYQPAEQIKLSHHTFIQCIMKWSCDDLKMTLLITSADCVSPHVLNRIKMAIKWSKAKVWLQQPRNSQSENFVSFLLRQHEVIRTVFILDVCVGAEILTLAWFRSESGLTSLSFKKNVDKHVWVK